MPHCISSLYGNRLGARDGDIGHVKDIYFDDRQWQVRYVVAETGSWLRGRQVLLSPHAFGSLEQEEKTLLINLTRKQIEDSPPIESHLPVSRQYEAEYFRYYGWPVYWIGDGFGGLGGAPGVIPVPRESETDKPTKAHDSHLRSTRAVTGYQVHALDGAVGHIRDFVVDDQSWTILELVVQTARWYGAKKVGMSPTDVERVSFEQSAVFVALTQEDFMRAGETVVATAGGAHRRALGLEE